MDGCLNRNSETVKAFFTENDNLIDLLKKFRQNCRMPFGGEYYITNDQLSQLLHLSKRTLQDYRDRRIIPFVALEGKILYRESDVERLLQQNYVKAFE